VATLTIYHNPRCSKSRETLALLEGRGLAPRIVKYLETPPTAAELADLVKMLGIRPEALVRKGEDVYRSQYAGRTLSDAEWIAAMVEHPVLIERPIVVAGNRAVIGRPPERVSAILDN
jgi:arsenate reductase